MSKAIKNHFIYYFSLLLILLAGLFLSLIAGPNAKVQGTIMIVTVISYVIWGILHHLISHELTIRIVIEYVLIGTLGISILFFVLVGGI